MKYDKQDQQGNRRSMNATPTRPSKKNQWHRAQEDPKQKQTGQKAEHGQTNH
jgi:hypothetical protein